MEHLVWCFYHDTLTQIENEFVADELATWYPDAIYFMAGLTTGD